MSTKRLPRGERVHLRRIEAADETAYLRAVRSSRRLHRPWSYPADTSERFTGLLERPAAETFLILRNGDDGLAGTATLGHIALGNLRSAYLGYEAFVPFEGRGYMTEGLGLVLRYAFGRLKLHRVEANVQPDNARSIALAERLGFRREGYSPRYLKIGGRWRDHVRYAILADEFGPVPRRSR